MVISRDDAIMPLITRYLALDDLLAIRRRLVGTGLVGGKTVGMLIARNIILRDAPELASRLEAHDSFYVGSDVFYTFLVRNGLWPCRERQHSPDTFLDGVDEAQEIIRSGTFPDYVLRQFENLLDYFGPYPFIVRSSSLLEDNYGRAFAGKYESVFCANQGPREERLRAFLDAVRTVYASTMSREALNYRARHDLLERDEQMALLIMRVTGSLQGVWFYPHLAGVGFSYNPFAWHPDIDPAAGVVRLVFGLGTRAVDRVDDDYTRVVALNAPQRRPEADFDDICRHSQQRVDAIDLNAGRLTSVNFSTLLEQSATDAPIERLTTRDDEVSDRTGREVRVLTFQPLLTGNSPFLHDLRLLLQTLQTAYARPIDIEFAVNFQTTSPSTAPGTPHPQPPPTPQSNYWIHLLQCRPLQVQGAHNPDIPSAASLAPDDMFLRARGAVVGHSRVRPIDWIIHVRPEIYATLGEQDRHAVARAVGQANRALATRHPGASIMAIGPGRWGTHMASLGVPVRFSEINHVSIICELAMMHGNLTPDISLGTHFFGEMVELNILYFGLFPGRVGNAFSPASFDQAADHFEKLTGSPAPAAIRQAVRIHCAADFASPGSSNLWLLANSPAQEVIISRVEFRDHRHPDGP